jgi:hypothetical protein
MVSEERQIKILVESFVSRAYCDPKQAPYEGKNGYVCIGEFSMEFSPAQYNYFFTQ